MRRSSITRAIANNFRTRILALAAVFLILTPGSGQQAGDSLASQFPLCALDSGYEAQKREQSAFYDQTNPVSMAFVGLINLYQRIFSAQEGLSTCQFRPSCSHFGALAIKKYGALQGTLMTGDRLLRCNPWTGDKYRRWRDNCHLDDPIEEHDLWLPDTL